MQTITTNNMNKQQIESAINALVEYYQILTGKFSEDKYFSYSVLERENTFFISFACVAEEHIDREPDPQINKTYTVYHEEQVKWSVDEGFNKFVLDVTDALDEIDNVKVKTIYI